MKKLWMLMLVIFLLVCLTGCGADTTTVMILTAQEIGDVLPEQFPKPANTNILIFDRTAEEGSPMGVLTEDGLSSLPDGPELGKTAAEDLASLLRCGADRYPADRYVLLLHGEGLIGSGVRMFQNYGPAALSELSDILEAFPQKPELICTDTPLAASAEYAHVLSRYTDHLIAPQTTAPDSSWIACLAADWSMETEALCDALARSDGAFTWLELSAAQELTAAAEGLFLKAQQDAEEKYADLAALRAQLQPVCDQSAAVSLVDAAALADGFSAAYPEECARLTAAAEALVRLTPNADLCGVSLFYPYHDRIRPTNSWMDGSEALGLTALPAYLRSCLQAESVDTAVTDLPKQEAEGIYAVTLPEALVQNFETATFRILKQVNGGTYSSILTGTDVTLDGDRLTASFDGNVIFLRDSQSTDPLPLMEQRKTIDGLTHYAFGNQVELSTLVFFSDLNRPAEVTTPSQAAYYSAHFAVDRADGTVSPLFVPLNTPVFSEDFLSGRIQQEDIGAYNFQTFINNDRRYLLHDDFGVLPAYSSWPIQGGFDQLVTGDIYSPEFSFEPLTGEGYFLQFEVLDKQGKRYGSKLLALELPQTPAAEESTAPVPTHLTWDTDSSIQLLSQQGVQVQLQIMDDGFSSGPVFHVRNDTDRPIIFTAPSLLANGSVTCMRHNLCVSVAPHSSNTSSTFLISDAFAKGAVDRVDTLGFTANVLDWETLEPLIPETAFDITLEEPYHTEQEPVQYLRFFDALAEEQTLLESDELKIELLGFGSDASRFGSGLCGMLRVTDRAGASIPIKNISMLFNGSTRIPLSLYEIVQPYAEGYAFFEISLPTLWDHDLLSIASAELLFPLSSDGSSTELRLPVRLASHGQEGQNLTETEEILYDKNGLRLSLKYQEALETGTIVDWYLTLVNDTDQAVTLHAGDILINDLFPEDFGGSFYLNNNTVGAHERTLLTAHYYASEPLDMRQISFCLQVYDGFNERLLEQNDIPIVLYP